jgi:hypothetical protein
MMQSTESKEDLARKQQATPVAGTAPAAEEPATVRVRGPAVHEVIKEIEEVRSCQEATLRLSLTLNLVFRSA